MPAEQQDDELDTLIIGAGIIGLAIGRALTKQGKAVAIIEQESLPGQHTSTHNSGVIHAGLYYPSDSLKARLCIRGKQLLYNYCQTNNIAHKQCGKVVIATHQGQIRALDSLYEQAQKNGVTDLVRLAPQQLETYCKGLHAEAALFSPSTGIVDSAELILSLAADFEAAGGLLACGNRFISADTAKQGFNVTIDIDNSLQTLRCQNLINCAGLHAAEVAACIAPLKATHIPEIRLARGNYFSVHPNPPFLHLVYPLPEPDGLGIHITMDIKGAVRLGPDVEWVNKRDYSVNATRESLFRQQVSDYWPGINEARLQPDYAGIRSKCFFNGNAQRDFIIQTRDTHGINGLINLFGIESPGLTAALGIAEMLAEMTI